MQDDYLQGLLELAVLLVLFLFKHFIADYPLQNKYMLRKSNVKGWFMPLVAHCAVHGALSFALVLFMLGRPLAALAVGVADFFGHGAIDWLSCRAFKYHQFHKGFWVMLGIDQYLHQVLYIALAVALLLP